MRYFTIAIIFLLAFTNSIAQVSLNFTGNPPDPSSMLDIVSTNRGLLIPRVSIDSLKDVTSIAAPSNGLIVFNTVEPGVRNDMQRGLYYYSTNVVSWVKMTDNLKDNVWAPGGLLGLKLRDETDGVEIMDPFTGSQTNFNPKVKILKAIDSASLNAKNNIPVLTLTGVNKKTVAGWEFRQKASIIFENNYLLANGITGATTNSIAISAYTENPGTNANVQTNGLAFYTFAAPQNTAVADTPSMSLFRHNVGIGAYAVDSNKVTEGRLQITGLSNGDQLSLRHPSSVNLKWGIYVSSIDSSLNFYSNGSLRANIDRVTGVYSALSDRNLKKQITPLQPVLQQLKSLPVYSYRYTENADTDRRSIGFMAQDVEPIFPELVFHKKDRETGSPFLMLTYQSFGPIAIKAIQEQQVIIDAQEQRIKKLEAMVEEIQSTLNKH
ncbi:MAG: tail fiber domain-containing protein [Ferruginibacter sp.]